MEDLENRLNSAFYGFRDPKIFVDTFLEVFRDFPKNHLVSMDEDQLTKAIEDIQKRDSVQTMQWWLREEIESVERYLTGNFIHLLQADLTKAGILTIRGNLWTRDQFREFRLYNSDGRKVVGHFPTGQDERSLHFGRGNTTYGDRCSWEKSQKEMVLTGFEEAEIVKGSIVSVYRSKISDKTKRIVAHQVIEDVKKEWPNDVLPLFKKMAPYFPGIYSPEKGIDLMEAYAVFEWVRRGYDNLSDVVGHSGFRSRIMSAVAQHVVSPLVELKKRGKQLERVAVKLFEVYHNVPSEGRLGGDNRTLNDVVGFRALLKLADLYTLLEYFADGRNSSFELVPNQDGTLFKDHIKRPKANGYMSVHASLRLKGEGYVHNAQFRTPEMERENEVGNASHKGHLDTKYDTALKHCAPQEVRFFSAVLGVDITPTVLKHQKNS